MTRLLEVPFSRKLSGRNTAAYRSVSRPKRSVKSNMYGVAARRNRARGENADTDGHAGLSRPLPYG